MTADESQKIILQNSPESLTRIVYNLIPGLKSYQGSMIAIKVPGTGFTYHLPASDRMPSFLLLSEDKHTFSRLLIKATQAKSVDDYLLTKSRF